MQANNPQAAERDMSEREKLRGRRCRATTRPNRSADGRRRDPASGGGVLREPSWCCQCRGPQTKHAAHRLGLLTAVLHLRDTFTLPTPKENERG